MADLPGEEETTSEIKFLREQSFFDRSSGGRFLIAAIFATCLLLFLHFREIKVEFLELGSFAKHYVVAQVDFAFFDEEATIILRQEAVRDVGKIYQLDERDIALRRSEFENYLIYKQEWRQRTGQSTFEEMYKGIDLLEQILKEIRFTDSRTRHKMEEAHFDIERYILYTPSNPTENVILPEQIWKQIGDIAQSYSPLQKGTMAFVINYFRDKTWALAEDTNAERLLRKQVQNYVPDKYTRVSAGSRIIDQGEKVTARHLAMFQAMKRATSDSRNLWHPMTLLGSLIMTALLVFVGLVYFRINHPEVLQSNRKLCLFVTVILLAMGLSKIYEILVISTPMNFSEDVRYPLFAPFVAILLCHLMNASIATFGAGFITVVLTMTLAVDRPEFLITNVITSLVAILSTRSLRRRKDIFIVCGLAWLACVVVILSIHLYEDRIFSMKLFIDLFSSGCFMLFTAVLVVGLLPLLESAFKIMTDVSLMEYMDTNHELVRRLTIEAPGTYQHSVVVGNLAEAAALAIGAHGLFCRVACIYHDIGKLATPQYFTENQQGGMNIHQLLTPHESTQVIINHVGEGAAMARKAGLPESFIDIIKEHHGTTLVYYFYRKQLELVEGDETMVNEADFRYAGPKPRTKESAIIMIADSLEAASRSLDQFNEQSLTALVESLVRQKADDGQFDVCQLTFEELGIVKKTMVKTLVAAGHSRIKYPTRERKVEAVTHGV